MDRNSIIGLILISALLFFYFQFLAPKPEKVQEKNQKTVVKHVEPDTETTQNSQTDTSSVAKLSDSARSEHYVKKYGIFSKSAEGTEKEYVLENKQLRVVLSSKGGTLQQVVLKNYRTFDNKPLELFNKRYASEQLLVNIADVAGSVDLHKLYFEETVLSKDGRSITFRLRIAPDRYLEQTYSLPEEGYLVDYKIFEKNLADIITGTDLQLIWKDNVRNPEKDATQTKSKTTVNWYVSKGDFNHLSERSSDEKKENVEQPLKWFAFKQNFFTSALIAQNTFKSGTFLSNPKPDDTTAVKMLYASVTFPVSDLKNTSASFKYFFGPNNYQVLKKVTDGFSKNVYLGYPVVKEINRFIVVPVFNFLQTFIGNYGIIILILVILVKLLLLPLSYRSYLSMAKMKVLKPEIDAIKEKYGDDLKKVQMEQMQLYRDVGVSPLSGCVPLLLQMPVLFAMFSFFPNSIELRQESFLWANDLSTYDSVLQLPFNIPFYGSHVSLFTILMTASTLFYTWFNSRSVSVQQGPMQVLQYVMPVIFMFVLNSFPAGLTYYYFVSNLVTIGQQATIRRFVNEDKIKTKLEEYRRKNKEKGGKKSRFQQRLEDAMKAKDNARKKK